MIYSNEGGIVAENNEFPESEMEKNYANTYHVSISPDESKFAIVSTYSAVIEMYNLPSLKRRYLGLFAGQEYDVRSGNIVLTNSTAVNFTDVYATNRHVYTAFSNIPVLPNKNRSLSEKMLENNNIDIYDWNGKPIRRIVTDYCIEKLCVDEKEEYAYAIISDFSDNYCIGKIRIR